MAWAVSCQLGQEAVQVPEASLFPFLKLMQDVLGDFLHFLSSGWSHLTSKHSFSRGSRAWAGFVPSFGGSGISKPVDTMLSLISLPEKGYLEALEYPTCL